VQMCPCILVPFLFFSKDSFPSIRKIWIRPCIFERFERDLPAEVAKGVGIVKERVDDMVCVGQPGGLTIGGVVCAAKG